MRKLLTFTLCLVIAFLPLVACVSPMPVDEGTALIAQIQEQVAAGYITPEAGKTLSEGIAKQMDPASGGGVDWSYIVGLVVAAGGAYFGVNLRRGKPTTKVDAEVVAAMISEFKKRRESEA